MIDKFDSGDSTLRKGKSCIRADCVIKLPVILCSVTAFRLRENTSVVKTSQDNTMQDRVSDGK